MGSLDQASCGVIGDCHSMQQRQAIPAELLRMNIELTDANAALFDMQPTNSRVALRAFMKCCDDKIARGDMVLGSARDP